MKPYQSLENELLNEQNLRHKLELDKREFCLQMREKAIVNKAIIVFLVEIFVIVPLIGLSTYLPFNYACNSRGNHATKIH